MALNLKYKNNAVGELYSGIADIGTIITLKTGHGDYFPAVASPTYFYATLVDDSGHIEIVKCTARTAASDELTVERGKESTAPRAWLADDKLELRITGGFLDDLLTYLGITLGAPSGTKMYFYQDTAPEGWVYDSGVVDTLLGIKGGTYGSVGLKGTWTVPGHTHTGPSHTHTGPNHTHTGPSHTHTGPSHTHTGPSHTHSPVLTGGDYTFAVALTSRSDSGIGADGRLVISNAAGGTGNTGEAGTGNTGASGTGNTGAAGTGATGASGTEATGSSGTPSTHRPLAAVGIIATKS